MSIYYYAAYTVYTYIWLINFNTIFIMSNPDDNNNKNTTSTTASSVNSNLVELSGKLEVLKKAYKDERKKKTELEEEIAKLNEENVIKQETIDKLKTEYMRLRENSKMQFPSFISGLFDKDSNNNNNSNTTSNSNNTNNTNEKPLPKGPDKKDEQITSLQSEIETLKDKISSLEQDKLQLTTTMNEAFTLFNKNQKALTDKKDELELTIQQEITSLLNDYTSEENTLKQKLTEQNIKVDEQNKSIQCMSELCRTFDLQKFNYEKEISASKKQIETYKQETETKGKEIQNILTSKKELQLSLNDYKEENLRLSNEVKQYKFIIEELTPLSIYHVFKGKILSMNKETVVKKVEISFGKVKHSMWYHEEGSKECVLDSNDITNIWNDETFTNRLWMKIYVNRTQKVIHCEFKAKEVKGILDFYKRSVQEKKDKIDNALIDTTLGVYY